MQWSDEIPEQILRGHGEFKIRLNWWSGIIGQIYLALDFINAPSVKQQCEEFLAKYAGTNYWDDCTRHTTREDIDAANTVVTIVIQNLESSSSC